MMASMVTPNGKNRRMIRAPPPIGDKTAVYVLAEHHNPRLMMHTIAPMEFITSDEFMSNLMYRNESRMREAVSRQEHYARYLQAYPTQIDRPYEEMLAATVAAAIAAHRQSSAACIKRRIYDATFLHNGRGLCTCGPEDRTGWQYIRVTPLASLEQFSECIHDFCRGFVFPQFTLNTECMPDFYDYKGQVFTDEDDRQGFQDALCRILAPDVADDCFPRRRT
jgi:hypothetical protein